MGVINNINDAMETPRPSGAHCPGCSAPKGTTTTTATTNNNTTNKTNGNPRTSSPTHPLLSPRLLVLLLLLLVPSVVLGRGEPDETKKGEGVGEEEKEGEGEEEERKTLLEPMMRATEKAVDFFTEDYSSINLDGLFGMRVAQGQLEEARKHCQSARSCPATLQRRLAAMGRKIDMAAEAALGYVKEADEEYFSRFHKVVDEAFVLPYRAQTLHHLERTPPGEDSTYQEEAGDSCLARIMGTFTEEGSGKTVERCNVTQFCWVMMTQERTCNYAVTHQLLYFSFIEKEGCTEQVEEATKAKVADTQERMCGSIYNEAVLEVKDNRVIDILQDLFLEQVMVCGTLGFENFLRSDWMRMVLTWQKASGCFSVSNPAIFETEKELIKVKEEERQIMKDLQQEANMIELQHGRKLLREQVMQDGCLSHKSGLGVGTLGMFTRYLIRQNFIVQ